MNHEEKPDQQVRSPSTSRTTVAIIGAGVSGIAMGRKLKLMGIDFTIFDKWSDFGGTWYRHNYPGLKCDIPYLAYGYAFDPGIHGHHRLLAPGDVIQHHLLEVVLREGLHEHARLGQEVVEARWLDDYWQLTTASGETHEAKMLVHAVGWLDKPAYPTIKGLDAFTGPAMHTARWDSSVKLQGQRVGIVGGGSSGIQLISELGGKVRHLTSFQRNPQWIIPLKDVALPSWLTLLLRSRLVAGFVMRRFWIFVGDFMGRAAMVDGKQRRKVEKIMRDNLETVKDPELRGKLTPKDPPLCKRPVMSGNYYEVMQRHDVSLVVEPIDRVEEHAVVTADGVRHEVDVLILATGYDVHAYMRPMKVYGLGGISIDDVWANGVFSYKTIGIPQFPNMFMIVGPFVSTSHIGLQEQVEAQVEVIAKIAGAIHQGEIVSICPSEEKTQAWMQSVIESMRSGSHVFINCQNYYKDKNGITVQWPWSRKAFFKMLNAISFDEFDLRRG